MASKAASLALLLVAMVTTTSGKPPNIVFIVIDDLGMWHNRHVYNRHVCVSEAVVLIVIVMLC